MLTKTGLRQIGLLVTAACLCALLGIVYSADYRTIRRVSVNSAGKQANDWSVYPVISADGRYIAFESRATKLVPNDTNNTDDIFVYNIKKRQTIRVSVSSNGVQANGESSKPSISADGRYVAFASKASNLVPGDTNDVSDIFVHDLTTGKTTRVNLTSRDKQINGSSGTAIISANGRFVAFTSSDNKIVPHDLNLSGDAFIRDLKLGTTTRVSLNSNGIEGNGPSTASALSETGRFVTIRSDASNLVPDDENEASDIFVHDRKTGITTRVSVSSTGEEAEGSSVGSSMSANGRFVAFHSTASNLTENATTTLNVFVHDRNTGETTLVSLSTSGEVGTNVSVSPSISANGRFVAFSSNAANLVPDDDNGAADIFVHDRETGETTRVSVNAANEEGNEWSDSPSINADGQYVVFEAYANNLVANDTNEIGDIFLAKMRQNKPKKRNVVSVPDRLISLPPSQ